MSTVGEVEFSPGHYNEGPAPQGAVRWALVMSEIGSRPVLTHHRIAGPMDRPRIQPGIPVDRGMARSLLESMLEKDDGGSSGWVRPDVFFQTPDTLGWLVPGKVRPMYFRLGDTRLPLRVAWPSMVLLARRSGALQVYAVKETTRPTPATSLYNAPLANVFADGKLCWGSVTPPAFSPANLGEYEAAIFRTYFTSPNHDELITTVKGDSADEAQQLLSFYRQLHSSKAPAFPVRRLVSFGQTLGEVCGA